MREYDTNQMSISLGAQLFLTHFVAAGVGVIVWMMMGPETVVGKTAVSLTIAGLCGFLLNWNIQRTLRQVDWTTRRIAASLPVESLTKRGHGPLTGLVAQMQRLIGQERPFHDLHTRELQQASELAAQEERQRLARDLHDSIKQQLFSIQVSAAAAQARWKKDEEGAKTAVSDVRHSAQVALVEVNALLQQLAQHPLETVGLAQALREQAEALAYRTGAEVDVTIAPLPDNERFPPVCREAMFRIAQEAMGNIARHARANQVAITLQPQSEHVQLRITDNGQGFDETAVTAGMGLDNMRQRAASIGGEMTIDSQPGQGTSIQLLLPLIETIAMKEKVMLKPNHTINRVSLVGIGGGLMTAAALYYPLYVLLPGRYLTNWQSGVPVIGNVMLIVAALLLVGTGFGAARGAGRPLPVWGAVAGMVAGMVAFLAVVGAGTAVIGSGDLLKHGLVPTESENAFLLLMVNATAGVMWWNYSGLWLMLLGGSVLGAVGGGLAQWRGLPEKRPFSTVPLQPVVATILFAGSMSSLLALIVTVAITALLGPQVAAAAEGFGWQLGSLSFMRIIASTAGELGWYGQGVMTGVQYPPLGASIWPMLSMLMLHLGLLGGLYWALQRLAADVDKSDQQQALVVAYLSAFFSGMGILVLPILVEDVLLRYLVLTGSAFIWILCIFLVRLVQSLETVFFPHLGEPMGTWRWLRKSPLLAIAMTFPLAQLGQSGIGFWLLVITAVLALFLIPRNWRVGDGVNQLAQSLSVSFGAGLAIALPILVPISTSLGLLTLAVYAISWINGEPGLGDNTVPPPGFTLDDMLHAQVNNLYLFNGFALLSGLLLAAVLVGIAVLIVRLTVRRSV